MTFSYGDRVVVKSVPTRYKSKYPNIVGAVGTVRSAYLAQFAVKLDGFFNGGSDKGYFYLEASSLRLAIDEFLDITNSGGGDLVLQQANCFKFELDDPMRLYCRYDAMAETAILKTFEEMRNEMEEAPMKNMTYDVPMLPNFTVVGVKFPLGDKEYAFACYEDNLSIGDVVVVRKSDGNLALTEVASIGLLDKSRVLNGCEVVAKVDLTASEARYAKAKEIADLKKDMDEKVAALQAVALYEMMAEKDPALKAMLEQFKKLTE
jgi:outer membrane murein-binding lipoprotein Lpp